MNYNKDTGGLVVSPVAVKVSFCLYVPFDRLDKELFFSPLLDNDYCFSEAKMILCHNQTVYP